MNYLFAFALIISTVGLAQENSQFFNRVASFPVNTNLPPDADPATETSAEIITATEDGMMLVYSDSPLGAVGMIDISDPRAPKAAGVVTLGGEPTSVTLVANNILAAVNTSESFTEPSGTLAVIDIASKSVTTTCDLGGQPDSVAVSPDGTLLAVAIENERDEEVNDGEIPQLPAGSIALFKLENGTPDCDSQRTVDVTGLAEVAGEDPEPEFIDFNDNNELAVTLQENNHVVIINAEDGSVSGHFSAGTVDLSGVDIEENGVLTFDGELNAVPREPDAVQWLDTERLVVANEGDYEGGSRGFTIFSKTGEVLFESVADLEHQIALGGHYPEARSDSKGIEPEGMEVKAFGEDTFIFILSERASVIGVYRYTDAEPEFVQLLPSALSPEGVVAIPERNLLAVSNEVDLIADGGVRSHVTLYSYGEGQATYPMIISDFGADGNPIGWGALSGLVADPERAGILYAVSDSFYSMQPTIFTIDATQIPARITDAVRVTRNGANAQLLDLEGITTDGEGGFWLASEGRTDRLIPHALYHVDAEGEIQEQIAFPAELLAVETRFGAEGITKIGDTLWIAIQRQWGDDPENTVKLVSYNLETQDWGAVRYPTEPAGEGWVGLSEITAYGDYVYIVERDDRIGDAAKLKKLYRVAISDLQPAALGGELPLVTKEEVHDFLPGLKATGGYVVDKLEGFAIDANGQGFAVTDNDGVDDSNGETLFFSIGLINEM
jgi:sugar lactone lactonase YvrE